MNLLYPAYDPGEGFAQLCFGSDDVEITPECLTGIVGLIRKYHTGFQCLLPGKFFNSRCIDIAGGEFQESVKVVGSQVIL